MSPKKCPLESCFPGFSYCWLPTSLWEPLGSSTGKVQGTAVFLCYVQHGPQPRDQLHICLLGEIKKAKTGEDNWWVGPALPFTYAGHKRGMQITPYERKTVHSELVPAHVAEKAKRQLASGLLFSLYLPLSNIINHLGFCFRQCTSQWSLKNDLLQVRINIHGNLMERDRSLTLCIKVSYVPI